MEKENNSNLPVQYKPSKFKQFMRKMQKPVLFFMTSLGIILPYAQQAADIMHEPVDNNKLRINEVVKGDVEARYEQAFSDLGVKVDFGSNMELPPDDPPQPEYEKEDKVGRVTISTSLDKDHEKFLKSLKGNVNAMDMVNKAKKYGKKEKDQTKEKANGDKSKSGEDDIQI